MSNYQVTVCDAHDHKVRVVNNPKTLKNAMRKAQIAELAAVIRKYARAIVVLNPDNEAVYISVVGKDGVIMAMKSAAKALKIVTGTYKEPVVKGTCEGDCE